MKRISLYIITLSLLFFTGCPIDVDKTTEKAKGGDPKAQKQLIDHWEKELEKNPNK